MVVCHAPAVIDQLKHVGCDHRWPVIAVTGRAEVFVENVDRKQRVLGAVNVGQFEAHPQPAFENFPPVFLYGVITLYPVTHGVNTFDEFAFRPHGHHGREIGIGKCFIEGLLGGFRCGKDRSGHIARYGTSLRG